ncbi:serine/threonine-protein phosphatase [Thermoleophilum album]|uniref:PP2C family protein-serine/threonine phosphatase n=1 Tax=Thermoleophilum album TaxID=29539 RepID=UPI00237CB290|nr:PP2C family protein-serine/threonine phosphatase [Thermoleophilum album]WDT93708.1 serine/threonine-protein phosphatase [Thermoleophilum album]
MWELASGATALLVGDAAGKGVERAALSAMVRFFVEARSSDASDPLDALAEANRLLCRRLPEDTFATAFFAVLERDRVRWALAGHLPPLVVEGGAVRELEAGGMPLGVTEDLIARRGDLELAPGTTLVAYTDGVTEARRDGELFGRARLVKLLESASPQSHPQAVAEQVRDAVRAFAGRAQDDLLVLALRRADGATDAAIESRPQ